MTMTPASRAADKFSAAGGFLSPAGKLVRDFGRIAGPGWVAAAASVLLGAVLEGAGIALLVPLLGLLFGMGAVPAWIETGANAAFSVLGAESTNSRLFVLLGIFAALMLLRSVVMYARDMAIFRLQLAFVDAQQMRVANTLAAARWENLARLRHARASRLMSGDMQQLGVGIHFLVRGLAASVNFAVQCVLAFLLAPALSALLLALLIGGVIAFGPTLARARSLGGYVADANLALLDTTTQFLGGLKLAMSQNLQASFVSEIRRTLHQLAARQRHFAGQYVLAHSAWAALIALASVAIVIAGLFWFHVAPPVLAALLLVVARMASPIGEIQQAAQQSVHLLAVYENALKLQADLTEIPPEHAAQTPSPYPSGDIVFADVTYVHARVDGAPAGDKLPRGICRLTLTIRRGEFVGIGGESGAGKTTFADLLVGLVSPQSGRIIAGGQDLNQAVLEPWRKNLAYVSQDSFLFHDTVRRNLTWGDPGVDEQTMWRALAAVGADDVVRRMENGLDTVVGERGTLVSGGERQRLALGRALLRNPKHLVLDEATGALDEESELKVLAGLRAALPDRTIVLISHRSANLAVCDRVVRFDFAGGTTIATPAVSGRPASTNHSVAVRS